MILRLMGFMWEIMTQLKGDRLDAKDEIDSGKQNGITETAGSPQKRKRSTNWGRDLHVADRNAFLAWLRKRGISEDQQYWLELYLGLRKEVLFARLPPDKIVQHLAAIGRPTVEAKTIESFVKKCWLELQNYLAPKKFIGPLPPPFLQPIHRAEAYASARALLARLKDEDSIANGVVPKNGAKNFSSSGEQFPQSP